MYRGSVDLMGLLDFMYTTILKVKGRGKIFKSTETQSGRDEP